MLVLHFDINDTITAFDKTDEISHKEKCNIIVARSVYGKVIDDEWVMNDDIYDEHESITFYDYIKGKDKDYKNTTSHFTENNTYGKQLYQVIKPMLDKMNKSFLFESFTNLVEKLDDNVKIIFRTFGNDGDKVLENFKHKDVLSGYFDVDKLCLNNGVILHGLQEINEFILLNKSHLFIQEDYHYWNNHGKDKLYGKQLMGSANFTQLFFDDNPCVHVVDNTNATFIKINTLQAMMDKDYYVNLIKKFLISQVIKC